MKDVNAWLDLAKNEIINLKVDEVFTLKDLYKGYQWNRISRGDRIMLGTLFLNFAKSTKNIHHLGKNNSGQQSYMMVFNNEEQGVD